MKIEDPQMDYYSSDDHSSNSGEETDHLSLIEPSPSSDSHEQRVLPFTHQVTVALIMDCPTIMVHAGKCYKALIDWEQLYLSSDIPCIKLWITVKIPLQVTMTKLNTADHSPMTTLGITALQLRIVNLLITL